MAQETPNYKLKKPDASDPFGAFRQLFNDNMDKIDQIGGGGGSGGHTIVDENGSDMPAEGKLQFTGAVSVTDDNVNGATVVNVLGGSNLILDAQIYSTEEKQVGVWTDKKPLYAKTYTAVITSGTQWIDTGLDSGDLIVKSEGTLEQNNGQILTLASGDTGAGAGINTFIVGVVTPSKWSCLFRTTSNDARGNLTLTLYYTKGSDVAGSGGYEAYGFSPVIYSDVERVIGVWRDNKPLYAKSITLRKNGVDQFTYSAYSYLNCLPADIEFININQMFMPRSGGDLGYVDVRNNYNEVQVVPNISNRSIYLWDNHNPTDIIITVQYTKTTDVAGSGDYNTYGVPTVHYDTNEQVIGTWFGKPLYQKAFTGLSQPTNGDNWVTINGVTIPNIGEVIGLNAFSVGGSGNMIKVALAEYSRNNNGDGVQVSVVSSAFNRTINTAVVQYTKSTD